MTKCASQLSRALTLGIVAVLSPAAAAPAQCGDWIASRPGPGAQSPVNALALHDFDADGPAPAELVVGGEFSTLGYVAARAAGVYDPTLGDGWGGWRALPGLSAVTVMALHSHDPDDAGPLPPELIAGIEGSLAQAGHIRRWTGTDWAQMGPGLSDTVHALVTFDPDRAGPAAPQLIAGGDFAEPGPLRISRWTGSAWAPLGGGTDDSVLALAVFDPDGDGPAVPELIAGGRFTTAGGTPTNHIARWDGTSWSPLGDGLNAEVRALAVFDPDGDGPATERLYAGGVFTASGSTSAIGIAQWTGFEWQPLGLGANGNVNALAALDADGDGPLPVQLIAGGTFSLMGGAPAARIARWDGAQWHPFFSALGGTVRAIGSHGPGGPHPGSMVIGGSQFGGDLWNIAQWDGADLTPMYDGITGPVLHAVVYDPDGPGADRADLIISGNFASAGEHALGHVVRWRADGWRGMSAGLAGQVLDFFELDPDQGGPAPPSLVAAGDFVVSGATQQYAVAIWDGQQWQPTINRPATSAHMLAAMPFDFDGAGPQPPEIVAAYQIIGPTGYVVLRWTGAAWVQLGPSFSGPVRTLAPYDPDGPGPLPARLAVGGHFTVTSPGTCHNVALWTGSAWTGLGPGVGTPGSVISSLHQLDLDGPGGLPPQLLVAGGFITSGTQAVRHVARWDGSAWQPFGDGPPGSLIKALALFDADGDGPLPEQLIAAGTVHSGVALHRWTGSDWTALAPDIEGREVYCLAAFDFDGAGPEPAGLAVGGEIGAVAGRCSGSFARWRPAGAPLITEEPLGATILTGEEAMFTVEAAGYAPHAYRWMRDGEPLSDGPTPHGSVVSGSGTPTLTLTAARRADSGDYTVAVSAPCAEASSVPAPLVVLCPADWDANFQIDSSDISAFLAAWLNSVQSGSHIADFNGDGSVNSSDIASFLTAWLAAIQGGC